MKNHETGEGLLRTCISSMFIEIDQNSHFLCISLKRQIHFLKFATALMEH